jgi:hypothetical protein
MSVTAEAAHQVVGPGRRVFFETGDRVLLVTGVWLSVAVLALGRGAL